MREGSHGAHVLVVGTAQDQKLGGYVAHGGIWARDMKSTAGDAHAALQQAGLTWHHLIPEHRALPKPSAWKHVANRDAVCETCSTLGWTTGLAVCCTRIIYEGSVPHLERDTTSDDNIHATASDVSARWFVTRINRSRGLHKQGAIRRGW